MTDNIISFLSFLATEVGGWSNSIVLDYLSVNRSSGLTLIFEGKPTVGNYPYANVQNVSILLS